MPYYYHISMGPQESEIITNYKKDKVVFFGKKDGFFNDVWKRIASVDDAEEYGGYREYEVFIPPEFITESLNPRENGKIYKITVKNRREFKRFLKPFIIESENRFKKGVKMIHKGKLIEELKKRGFIGIDCHIDMGNYIGLTDELIIFDMTPFIKNLKLVEIKVV